MVEQKEWAVVKGPEEIAEDLGEIAEDLGELAGGPEEITEDLSEVAGSKVEVDESIQSGTTGWARH